MGSVAIACVNYLKLPLVLLPLRSLLLEQAKVPPPTGLLHLLLTASIVVIVCALAYLSRNLAFAFQITGATAGAIVCFIMPGMLHLASLRIDQRDLTKPTPVKPSTVLAAAAWMVPRNLSEAGGLGLALAGFLAGAISFWVTLSSASSS